MSIKELNNITSDFSRVLVKPYVKHIGREYAYVEDNYKPLSGFSLDIDSRVYGNIISQKEDIYAYSKLYSPKRINRLSDNDESQIAFWSPKKLLVNILHNKFEISNELFKLYYEINDSKKYLDYKEDWDDDNAIGCNPITYMYTIKLLITYANYVFKFHDIIMNVPEINLAKDGSFDLEWRCNKRMLLMNIINSKNMDVHYYGEDFESRTILKGFLNGFEINRELSHWMQELI